MSDVYDFTTLGITPGSWGIEGESSDYLHVYGGDLLIVAALSYDSQEFRPSQENQANANLIAAAPDFLRYAMWEEEMAYINAHINEGLDTKLANLEIIVLACKYFPEISELLSSMDDDDDEEKEAEKFWAAVSKASLKLRQDALASVGLPALVDTDGESLIVRENGGAA